MDLCACDIFSHFIIFFMPVPLSLFFPKQSSVHFLDEMPATRLRRSSNEFATLLANVNLARVIDEASESVDHRFNQLEPKLSGARNENGDMTLASLMAASLRPSRVVRNFSWPALVAEETTRRLVRQARFTNEQIWFDLPELDLRSSKLRRRCPKPSAPASCYAGRYRSYTGHCNNVEHPEWGAANTAFGRWLLPVYHDGVAQPRAMSVTDGQELPSAREVSMVVHQDKFGDGQLSSMTTMATFFGQFIFHDLSHPAMTTSRRGELIKCCRGGRPIHPECLPIRGGGDCLEYVRSSPALRDRCRLGAREQVNQASSYLDASPLYGATKERAHSLRAFVGGRLKTINLFGREKEFLPMDNSNRVRCRSSECFLSGDERVNENLGLSIVHTMLMREHNRIAAQLAQLNRHWDDALLFEETRRIVIAQLQHITYKEFLPHILGEEAVERYNLRLQGEDFYHGYNMSLEGTVVNSVGSAVLSFLHTMMPPRMERYREDMTKTGEVPMVATMFNPSELIDKRLEEYVLGMISQNTPAAGATLAMEMTNSIDNGEMFDLAAFTIQQGRDHGLRGYLAFRAACGLQPKVANFDDLITIAKRDTLKRIASVYKHVEDIDLYTGGLAEKPLPGAMVGPTFACLLGRTFDHLRRGDRFWYENDMPTSAFTRAQLGEIRKATLARLICENGDRHEFVQPDPMVSSDPYLNAFQLCNSQIFDPIDLRHWVATGREHAGNVSALVEKNLIKRELNRARRDVSRQFEKEALIVPSHGTRVHYRTTHHHHRVKRQTLALTNQSMVLEKATYRILKQLRVGRDRETGNDLASDVNDFIFSLSKAELSDFVRNEMLLESGQQLHEECDEHDYPCDHTSPYRSYTGWCNNLEHPDYGKSMSIFERFLPASYEDGVGKPRTRARHNSRLLLPSPRLVSTSVHDDISTPHVRYSLAVMQWGQFIDHDFAITPQYLTSGGQLLHCQACDSARTVHPECHPIAIPANDPFFKTTSAGQRCLHFVRSINAQQALGRREQMNLLTSYIDASQIYASNTCEARLLRAFDGGRLNSTRHPIGGLKDLLPEMNDHIECVSPSRLCFRAGDLRASENPGLTSMHTIWMREHNRIADQLARMNKHWDDERVFQTARKIVTAQVQHITWGEFVPRLIGMDLVDRFGLKLLSNGYDQSYDSQCTGMLRNEIATAVFRLGHTLLKPGFERLDVNYKTIRKPLLLREAFFNSEIMYSGNCISLLDSHQS